MLCVSGSTDAGTAPLTTIAGNPLHIQFDTCICKHLRVCQHFVSILLAFCKHVDT